MEWLKSFRLGGSRKQKTRRFRGKGGKGPKDPQTLPLRPEDNYPPRTLPLRPDNYPPRTMPGRPGSYIPPDRPERSGMGGQSMRSRRSKRSRRSRRSKRSRQYRRAGGLEPDEEPSGSSVSNSPIPIRPVLPPAPRPRMTPEEIAVAASLAQAAEEANIAPYRK